MAESNATPPARRYRFRLKGLFVAMIFAGIAASASEVKTLGIAIWVTLTLALIIQAMFLGYAIVSEGHSREDVIV
jgi:hypothetical protein